MKKRKKRIKLKGFLIALFVIVLVSLLGLLYINMPVKNIYVKGNSFLKEQVIIDEAGLSNYPKLSQVSRDEIKRKLLDNDLINDVKIAKSLFGKIIIEIEENKIICQKEGKEYILSNGKMINLDDDVVGIPTLINDVPDNIFKRFTEKLCLVDPSILLHISEISYAETEYDNERFLFYMIDGNYVYITLSKIELINSYSEIYPTLEGNKGVLYLDSGNHFEIKKKID